MRNNLAYPLFRTEPSNVQLRRAAILATEALEHPEILATRGAIRVGLNDYEASTTDLQKALESRPSRRELHALLAECYDALGMKSLAATHREKVASSGASAGAVEPRRTSRRASGSPSVA